MKPRAISLFSGAGLSSQGVVEAGYEVAVCVENAPDAVRTLHNLGRHVASDDVKTIDWGQLRRDVGYVDLVEGGPPCQPFSSAGKGKGADDKRDCIPDFALSVQAFMPRLFIMENVRALTFKSHRAYLDEVLDWFPEEYQVDWRVLNAADYGVPQTRQRLFIVGALDGPVRWPAPTHGKVGKKGSEGLLPWVTMAEALDFPDAFVLRHGSTSNAAVRSGDEPAATLLANIEKQGGWAWERPATTVVASFCPDVIAGPGYRKAGDGPRQNAPGSIRVTPEQAATLQDFPPDWPFHGSRSSIFKQIGNACPRTFTRLIAQANAGDE